MANTTKQQGHKVYKIPCVWQMWGILRVKAKTLEEATRLAIEEYPCPANGHYIEDSFEIDTASELYGQVVEQA